MVANDDGVVISFEGEKTAYSLSHWENLRESHSMLPEYITTGLIVTGNVHRTLEPAVCF